MKTGFNYYRVKTAWMKESPDGEVKKAKTEDLVYAANYTDAEKVAYAIIEDQKRTAFGEVNVEIIKTKISEMLYNDNLDHDNDLVGGLVYNFLAHDDNENTGIYAVRVIIITADEVTAKEKRTSEVFYTPASSNTDAAKHVSEYLRGQEFLIRDIKFDKAESVLWPMDEFTSKTKLAG